MTRFCSFIRIIYAYYLFISLSCKREKNYLMSNKIYDICSPILYQVTAVIPNVNMYLLQTILYIYT